MNSTQLQARRSCYAQLAYFAARAEDAISRQNMDAHMVWATKYHDLKNLLEG